MAVQPGQAAERKERPKHGALNAAWDFWKAYAEKVGHYQTTIILTLIYWLVVGPIWAVGRLTRHHFLPTRPHTSTTFWRQTQMGNAASGDDLKKQG